ncbi:zinc-finger domain-containing protein [Bacillus marinisedimentorum]|uniref:zinc-finger domain-containing protein n=1 Tax=Bacillus marinisedimentorum TaxID=1821260 RepID=UPI0007E28DB0|nr:zinc-finger domain-containing protein [Bacillus marinisedimentorum]
MNRVKAVKEAGSLLDTYCSDCFLKEHHRRTGGKAYAHSFCINSCTVGEKLQEYGSLLAGKQEKNC